MLTALELRFADGDYLFDLKLPQLIELQRLRGAGVFAIYGRVRAGRFVTDDGDIVGVTTAGQAYIEDIRETIRLGLIGGGKGVISGAEVQVSAIRARELVETYVDPAPLRESWSIAAAVLGARIEGWEPPAHEARPEPKKKAGSAARKTTGSTKRQSSPTA